MDGEFTATTLAQAPPRAGRSALLASVILIGCCVLWGYSFPVMQFATTAFDRHVLGEEQGGSGTGSVLAARAGFNGLRFGLAAVLYAGITLRRQSGFARDELVGGVVVGAYFAAGMLLQTTGLRWALPSVSSFLTALAVVFAPVAQAMFLRRRVGRPTWVAVGLAMVGMTLLSWPKADAHGANTFAAVPPVPLLGEGLTVLASVLFTGQILAVDHFGGRADPARLTLVVLGTTSVLSLGGAVVMDEGGMLRAGAWAGVLNDKTIWWSVGTLVVFSSVAAIHLMNTWQPLVSPATASVIYCTEPLFGTMFSVMLGTERLTLMTLVGGAAVLGGVVIVSRFASVPSPAWDGNGDSQGGANASGRGVR